MSNIIDSIQVSGVTYQLSGSSSGGNNVVELTQAEYDALVDKDPTAFYIITDATAGDLTQYWTSAQTQSAITSATSGKVDTTAITSSVTSTSTDAQIPTAKAVYDAVGSGGGGKAIEAGRGISITTGETADTVSFNLPISAGTMSNNLIIGESTNISNGIRSIATGYKTKAQQSNAFAQGYKTDAGQEQSHAEGYQTKACGVNSHSEGKGTSAMTTGSHAEGFNTITSNSYEHTQGQYNVSSSASTTFGDSGNTLFSVGNGTADNARHNAFEIRQNGDIYLSSGGTDIKLQDHLGGGGGGSSYTAGDGIDITNDVISVSGVSHNSLADGTKMLLRGDFTINGQNYSNIRFDYYYGTSFNKNNITIKPLTINGESALRTQASSISVIETSAISTSVTSSSTDSQVPSAKAVNDKLGGLSLVKLTQAEYDALSTKDSNTLYVIVN